MDSKPPQLWNASNSREDVREYSPLQHALGRARDLDGRLKTLEDESLLQYKQNLWMRPYGNNIKRMQDSEINFLRLDIPEPYVQGSELQEPTSTGLSSRDIRVLLALKDKRETTGSFKGIAQVLCAETRREETMNKKGPQGNILFCLEHRHQEDVYGSVELDD